MPSACLSGGVSMVDLPHCKCGGDFLSLWIDVDYQDGQIVLVGSAQCGDCDHEVEFVDSTSATWRDAVLRCVNAWSVEHGGYQYSDGDALPDDFDELVVFAEGRFGPLPEYRAQAEVMAKEFFRSMT